MPDADIVELFLEGAQVLAAAVAAPVVAEAWDRPSVLEGQRVGGLAGHVARSGGWIVADYVDGNVPPGATVDFSSPGDYFHKLLDAASPADHEAIRRRGADAAAAGHDELCRVLEQRLNGLGPRLCTLEASRLIAVTGGKVLRLDDYLATRIVEQVVHLDDLARSVERDPWPMPAGAIEVAVAVGTDIALRRGGGTAVIRALYRGGWAASVFPVL